MTRDEFFNTYFTGQKELAVMAAMTAPERAQFLSRVLGYERIRSAQERLKEKRSALRARLEALQVERSAISAELDAEAARADDRLAAAAGRRPRATRAISRGRAPAGRGAASVGASSSSSGRPRLRSRPSSESRIIRCRLAAERIERLWRESEPRPRRPRRGWTR